MHDKSKQLKEKALIHAELNTHKSKIFNSIKIIKDFLLKCRDPYVAFSGGKDSAVVAHLSNLLSPNILMLYIKNDDLDLPENTPTVKKISDKFNFNLKIIQSNYSGWELLKNRTSLFNYKGSELDKKCFFEPLNNFLSKENYDGYLMGLRADESRAREMNYRFNGHTYQKKNRMWVCNPISNWKGIDVFAYLFKQNIPIHPVYFKTDLGTPPERLREGWWPPTKSKGNRHGYCKWLKYYYPDLFNKIAAEFPEVRNYV